MILARLHARIAAVCPIIGVSRDGGIQFAPEAKITQHDDAYAVLRDFNWVAEQAAIEAEEKAAKEHAEFLRTLTPKTITDLQAKLTTAETELANAKARLAKLETAKEATK